MATIENINHDSGGAVSDHWTKSVTDTSGRLSITTDAALGGTTRGLQCAASTGVAAATVTETMTSPSTNELRFGFRYDPNSPNAPTVTTRTIFSGIVQDSGGGFGDLITVQCSITTASVLQVSVSTSSDSGTTGHGASTITDEPHCFECKIVRASASDSNDGQEEFFVDGISKYAASGIDNYDNFAAIDEVQGNFPAPENDQAGSIYFVDEFLVDDSGDADLCAAIRAFRLLGLAADSGHLYATGLEDSATLKLYDYALSNLAEGASPSSFGSGTIAEIDAACRGIFPVVRPGAACYLYLYGRDGNDVQLQKNDMNNASGWQDIGAGSATWDASKVAVGLHPSIFDADDLVMAFTDGDIYRSRTEGASWKKQGAVSGSLLTSTRHPTDDNKIFLGGSLAGAMDYSHNYGISSNAIDISNVAASRDHRILASADDGYVSQSSSAFINNSTINFGDVIILGQLEAWLRFGGVAISPSSVVSSAYIQFESSATESGSVTLVVYGEDADSPTAASDRADFNARTRTAASVSWSPSNPWTSGCTYTTPDISTVVQEIVDRSGWALNNAMQFFVEYSAGCTGTVRQAESFDTASTLAPLLHIESTGCGGVINHIEVNL